MSVKREPSGRRSIQVEVEVPGTPEQVWQAIASGPGVTAWFVPTTIEPRKGGKMTCTWAPGMESSAIITGWDPPRMLTAESEGLGPGAPPMATEWTVQAKAGGTCIVRVVHSLFASKDDWDGQLEGVEAGWPTFFEVLRLYLLHHAGEPCTSICVMAGAPGTAEEAWAAMARPLGIADAGPGQRTRAAAAGAPPFAGTVDRSNTKEHGKNTVVRLTEPAPGVAVIGAEACGPVMAMAYLYLYGPRAAAAAQRDDAKWRSWMEGLFAVKA